MYSLQQHMSAWFGNNNSGPARLWPAVLVLVALLPVTARAESGTTAATQVAQGKDTFTSGGKAIAVERFEPAAPGKYPAVLLLHSLDGLENSCSLVYRLAAEQCAGQGYVVVLVHYFDRTGTGEKELSALRKPFLRWGKGDKIGADEQQTIRTHFNAWTEAVEDAVRYTRARPNVDGSRVGLVGFSLGAFLALAVAAEEDLKIAAVVDFFGGLPEERRARLTKLPPALIVHGDQDQTVPVREARLLGDWLAAHQSPGEVKIYLGVDHVFAKARGGFNLDALRDAQVRAAAFLDRHLKKGDGESKPLAAVGR
jgi:carboxymethylenebutenolidase